MDDVSFRVAVPSKEEEKKKEKELILITHDESLLGLNLLRRSRSQGGGGSGKSLSRGEHFCCVFLCRCDLCVTWVRKDVLEKEEEKEKISQKLVVVPSWQKRWNFGRMISVNEKSAKHTSRFYSYTTLVWLKMFNYLCITKLNPPLLLRLTSSRSFASTPINNEF